MPFWHSKNNLLLGSIPTTKRAISAMYCAIIKLFRAIMKIFTMYLIKLPCTPLTINHNHTLHQISFRPPSNTTTPSQTIQEGGAQQLLSYSQIPSIKINIDR